MNQEPIGLDGCDNLYWFASNVSIWLDHWGLNCNSRKKNPWVRKRRKTMYLSDIDPELNSEINNIICESRQAKTLQERIDELMRAWDLIPKPATQFVTPTSGLCSEISGRFKELKDYSKALEWINIALEARKTVPDGSTFLWAGIIYYELGDMENAYKYFDLTYNELRYTPFSMEDKKYWQFYKQRKEELNPKKKNKK